MKEGETGGYGPTPLHESPIHTKQPLPSCLTEFTVILLDKSLMRVVSSNILRTRIGLCGGTELSKYQWSLMQFETNP
jgi:hypothetical protein